MAQGNVIVIGAGLGGLAAAVAARRAGADVMVFERRREGAREGLGLGLWTSGTTALDRLGVRQAAFADFPTISRIVIRDQAGRLIKEVLDHRLGRDAPLLAVIVERHWLLETLLSALGASRVRFDMEFVKFEQEASEVVAHFADGRTERADLLVGADGLHSRVRHQLHPQAKPRSLQVVAWRGITTLPPNGIQIGTGSETWGRGAVFGLHPMDQGRWYWYASATNADSRSRSLPLGDRDELLRRFHGWHDPIEQAIRATDTDSLVRTPLYDLDPLTKWGNGRVSLLGDAAHAVSPALGQGGCMALQDAVALGACIRERATTGAALEAYERRRRRHARSIARASRLWSALLHSRSPTVYRLRDLFMRRLPPKLLEAGMKRI
jgi:2-polyprenyl-6-methoxyphenol hydroxylase-like FAD-dependent oxidoreductase